MPNSTISHGDLEKYWETVVSTIKDGVMIVDTTGCIVFANEAMESITGYDARRTCWSAVLHLELRSVQHGP